MITVVVMVGGVIEAPGPEGWVSGARRAAACDLIEQIARQPFVGEIVVVSPDPLPVATEVQVRHVQSRRGSIHVGDQLTAVIDAFAVDKLLYFGGGSAPLLDDLVLHRILEQLAAEESAVFTNNQYASDWAGVAPAATILDWKQQLPQDNMLGWVLSAKAGLTCYAQPASAASRLDIDTPTDLLTLVLHGNTRPHLRRFLNSLPLDTSRLEAGLTALATPASQVFIAGRIGPHAWQALNRVTQCWLRVVSEERGMVSSGRQARGEVYSMLADHLEAKGIHPFFATLAEQAQAAFIDTRVILAHHRRWPTKRDRFASDLGLVEDVQDPLLSEITKSALEAPIPVILGGHGLLSGDLLAFCDLL